MADGTIQTRNASIYWNGARVDKTRNFAINLGSDWVEDTVHGSTTKSFAPTFSNFDCKVTGLYKTGAKAAGNTAQLIYDALNQVSGYWSIYIGNASQYFYGNGYVSIDNIGAPYTDFAPADWTLKPIGSAAHYAIAN